MQFPGALLILAPQRHANLTPSYVVYACIAGGFGIAWGFGYLLKRLLHRWKVSARTGPGELALSILETLPLPLFLLIWLYVAMEYLPLNPTYEKRGSEAIFALVVVVIFYFISKAATAFLRRMAQRQPALERATQPAILVLRLVFIILATVIILGNLGIHLVAVWTTLGVGSVAVALGLQETLSNAFAGLYIMADQPVGPGDYMKLDSGQEGYVVRIGWRATSVRTLNNNIVYIPNSSLAKAMITNYSKPEERMSVGIPVSVAYATDPYRVEKLLVEIARDAAREGLDGLLAQPEPSARLIPGFGASSLDFSLNVQVRRFVDQYLVQSELRKRILARFGQEGIEMPFPTRTVVLDPASAELLARRDSKP
ncbi:MAG: mechanosensitive ion channel family protein [Terriglobia bacterium]